MQHRSTAVEFPTLSRAHIALAVSDFEASLAFYSRLFEREPSKLREGYAKFELLEPPLNLTLNRAEAVQRPRPPAHFGVQVKSTQEVLRRRLVMTEAGHAARSEEGVGCCYAVQDKVWFEDPDGNHWEVFVVTEADIPEHSRPAEQGVGPGPFVAEDAAKAEAPCCEPSCCK